MTVTLFGILNITADSFSDGGKYLEPEAALAHALALANDADAVDIGAASSNPSSQAVPPEIEIARMAPVVAALRAERIPISIDSFAVETQRWALERGVDYLNDIQGFPYPELYPALAASPARLVVMHSVQGFGIATRVHVPASELMDRILAFFDARIDALTSAGIARERLILDPGMGLFLGSDPDASFAVLRRLPELVAAFGLPILISVSRKSFLRRLTGRGPREAGAASLAAELFAVEQGATHIRTHDPAALKDALAVVTALRPGNPR